MHWGGTAVIIITVIAALAAMIHSNIKFKAKNDEENGDKMFRSILRSTSTDETDSLICSYVSANECTVLGNILRNYRNVTEGLTAENIKLLRKAHYELMDKKGTLKNIRRKETICVRRLSPETAMRKGTWFFASFNGMEQLYYTIRRICEPAYEHVDNHFSPLPEKYIHEFTPQRDRILGCMEEIIRCCNEGDYAALKAQEDELRDIQHDFSSLRKALVEEIRGKESNINVGYLYLNTLQESEQMAIILKQMIRSSRKFQLS